jgi:hypothetical protein
VTLSRFGKSYAPAYVQARTNLCYSTEFRITIMLLTHQLAEGYGKHNFLNSDAMGLIVKTMFASDTTA